MDTGKRTHHPQGHVNCFKLRPDWIARIWLFQKDIGEIYHFWFDVTLVKVNKNCTNVYFQCMLSAYYRYDCFAGIFSPVRIKCLDELHSLASPVRNFITRTRCETYTIVNHLHSIPILFVISFCLQNRHPMGCFPDHQSRNLFKSTFNCCVPHTSS